jgi:UDP-N-acetylmuramyl pentapeptide phosphotransferase/UDP-N-acetylglucosamine-1-phosphate transferase
MSKWKKDSHWDEAGMVVAGGVIVGLGAGFYWHNIPAGLFMGLGFGLVAGGITAAVMKKREK